MAILSKRLINDIAQDYIKNCGLAIWQINVTGRIEAKGHEYPFSANTRRKISYAFLESVNLGIPYIYTVYGSIAVWVIGLEDRNIVHGGILSGGVWLKDGSRYVRGSMPSRELVAVQLAESGMDKIQALKLINELPEWEDSRIGEAAEKLQKSFYIMSGWKPELMNENRIKQLQKQQFTQAVEDQRKSGTPALYAFEKERVLLANIKAGDKSEARRILNEMLATIYLSSQKMPVLRARTIELMSYLTRAAIEDNPFLEPMIERNHAWIEKFVQSKSFEELSKSLMGALDEFIDSIFLHGINRSNKKVRDALDYINANYSKQISLDEISEAAGLSTWRFAHLIKNMTGKTFMQILQQVRIQNAQHLLERTAKSCTDIAYECGYNDQSYFIKHFRRITGTTPAKYRKHGA